MSTIAMPLTSSDPNANRTTVHWTTMSSPVGALMLAATKAGVCGIEFCDDDRPINPSRLAAAKELSLAEGENAVLAQLREELTDYFAGVRRSFDVPLDVWFGTTFQRSAWQGLCTIGYGETISYGDLAKRIGNPTAVRAVGAANGRNPVSIVVPCHRVVNQSGRLHGYGGGLWRKKFLLELETGAEWK